MGRKGRLPVLTRVADGVLVHESRFLQSHAVVVEGSAGLLLIDPGVLDVELAAIAGDVRELGLPIVAGFSTHPHWDHLLWDVALGTAPRYATARAADTARTRLSDPGAKSRVAGMIPPDIVDQVPLDLLGGVSPLSAETTAIPWDGPRVRIIEHQAHAAGHAALLIEQARVLVAGDMLSDVLVPLLDLGAPDPIGDYLAGLDVLEATANEVDVVVPGHGSVGDGAELRRRIDLDRAYVRALRDGVAPDDPRIGPAAAFAGMRAAHERQVEGLAQRV